MLLKDKLTKFDWEMYSAGYFNDYQGYLDYHNKNVGETAKEYLNALYFRVGKFTNEYLLTEKQFNALILVINECKEEFAIKYLGNLKYELEVVLNDYIGKEVPLYELYHIEEPFQFDKENNVVSLLGNDSNECEIHSFAFTKDSNSIIKYPSIETITTNMYCKYQIKYSFTSKIINKNNIQEIKSPSDIINQYKDSLVRVKEINTYVDYIYSYEHAKTYLLRDYQDYIQWMIFDYLGYSIEEIENKMNEIHEKMK